jgi:hypothetical protein
MMDRELSSQPEVHRLCFYQRRNHFMINEPLQLPGSIAKSNLEVSVPVRPTGLQKTEPQEIEMDQHKTQVSQFRFPCALYTHCNQ